MLAALVSLPLPLVSLLSLSTHTNMVSGITPPYIRARCDLDETNGNGFCIDVLGRFAADVDYSVVQGHTCKASDGPNDLKFGFGNNDYNTFSATSNEIGQIYGTEDLLDGRCVAVYCPNTNCTAYAANCTDLNALSVFRYDKDSLQFELLGSVNDFNEDSDSSSDSSSDSDSDSDDDDGDGLNQCLRLSVDTVVQDLGFLINNIKTLFIQDCDDIDDKNEQIYSEFIIFDDEENDPNSNDAGNEPEEC